MLTKLLPSYAYAQYRDDSDVLAFVKAFNTQAQEYIDLLNSLSLPIYTGAIIAGSLLDWVGTGLYNIVRPTLPAQATTTIRGALNTLALNTTSLNAQQRTVLTSYYVVSDDIYKRIITWNFYKGDGNTFSIRWLKRRVMRFLTGADGVDPGVNSTYQISVTFGAGNQVNIGIRSTQTSFSKGTLNSTPLNSKPLNGNTVSISPYPPLPNATIFASAVSAGVLQLPFQYTYVVNVV